MAEDKGEFGEPDRSSSEHIDGYNEPANPSQRIGILSLLDDFIYQMLSIRKMLFIIFISSILLAPVSIVLSLYLFNHPSFEKILNAEDNFGEVLEVLLVAIFIVSSIWLVMGIKQYRSIGSWSKRYEEFQRDQRDMENKIMLKYGLLNPQED